MNLYSFGAFSFFVIIFEMIVIRLTSFIFKPELSLISAAVAVSSISLGIAFGNKIKPSTRASSWIVILSVICVFGSLHFVHNQLNFDLESYGLANKINKDYGQFETELTNMNDIEYQQYLDQMEIRWGIRNIRLRSIFTFLPIFFLLSGIPFFVFGTLVHRHYLSGIPIRKVFKFEFLGAFFAPLVYWFTIESSESMKVTLVISLAIVFLFSLYDEKQRLVHLFLYSSILCGLLFLPLEPTLSPLYLSGNFQEEDSPQIMDRLENSYSVLNLINRNKQHSQLSQFRITIDSFGSYIGVPQRGEKLVNPTVDIIKGLSGIDSGLFLMAGVGADMISFRTFFQKADLTGVEVNTGLKKLAHRFPSDLRHPDIINKIHWEDLRLFLKKNIKKYSYIHIGTIGSPSVAFQFSSVETQNKIYTIENLDSILGHLKEDGILQISQGNKVQIIYNLLTLLQSKQYPTNISRFLIFSIPRSRYSKWSNPRDRNMLFLKPSGFSDTQVEALSTSAREIGWELVNGNPKKEFLIYNELINGQIKNVNEILNNEGYPNINITNQRNEISIFQKAKTISLLKRSIDNFLNFSKSRKLNVVDHVLYFSFGLILFMTFCIIAIHSKPVKFKADQSLLIGLAILSALSMSCQIFVLSSPIYFIGDPGLTLALAMTSIFAGYCVGAYGSNFKFFKWTSAFSLSLLCCGTLWISYDSASPIILFFISFLLFTGISAIWCTLTQSLSTRSLSIFRIAFLTSGCTSIMTGLVGPFVISGLGSSFGIFLIYSLHITLLTILAIYHWQKAI